MSGIVELLYVFIWEAKCSIQQVCSFLDGCLCYKHELKGISSRYLDMISLLSVGALLQLRLKNYLPQPFVILHQLGLSGRGELQPV